MGGLQCSSRHLVVVHRRSSGLRLRALLAGASAAMLIAGRSCRCRPRPPARHRRAGMDHHGGAAAGRRRQGSTPGCLRWPRPPVPAANGCVTVGWYYDTAGNTWGLIETQNGTTWTDTEAPQPSDSGTGSNQGFWFGSQSAASPSRAGPCRARPRPSVWPWGSTWTRAGSASRWSRPDTNGTWTSSTAALPSDAATDADRRPSRTPTLFSVSCSSHHVLRRRRAATPIRRGTRRRWSTRCRAAAGAASPRRCPPEPRPPTAPSSGSPVRRRRRASASGGYHDNTSGSDLGLLDVLANGTWTPAAAAPLPSNAAHGQQPAQHSPPDRRARRPTSCAAIGIYDDLERGEAASDRDLERDELERRSKAPLPVTTTRPRSTCWPSVSCASPSLCVAVGTYGDARAGTWG